MPRYAVDFLAEIQEVTSATNLDDCSDSLDLLTNCHYFNVSYGQASEANNVVNALMGNAQCCFKRYPGYQAHRHVVVSRGVQCSEAIIRKNIDVEKDIDNNNLFSFHTNERGDTTVDNCKETIKLSDSASFLQHKANSNSHMKLEFLKNKSEVCTLVTEEPPELRASSKFFKKPYEVDFSKPRKYVDDDIDSLSATISNYSLHEKLVKFDPLKLNSSRNYEQIDKNNHQSSTTMCMIPTPRQRQISFKGSTDAIRGSTTKTLTCRSNDSKISNKNDCLENQSSDSFTSFGHCKDFKSKILSNSSNNTDTTALENEKFINEVYRNTNNETNLLLQLSGDDVFQRVTPRSNLSQHLKTKVLPTDKTGSAEYTNEEKPIKNSSDSKCSSSVTFVKGSEELHNSERTKSMELNNLNALRRKQKFLMRHTRNSNKFSNINNADYPPPIVSPDFPSHFSATKIDSTPVLIKSQTQLDYQEIPLESTNQKSAVKNTHVVPSNNETSQNLCASRNSNHSERIFTTPNTNTVKLKRTVSFDKTKIKETLSKTCIDQKNSKVENSNQSCTRSTVRAKYCSNKVIKQRFYIPESANIESILRDPSDRRIKAICDRHNCDIEIYSKVPKSGFLKNIIVLAAPNSENLRKCVRSLDYSMVWCLTAQLP